MPLSLSRKVITNAAEAAEAIGIGFCRHSVSLVLLRMTVKVGIGHGNLPLVCFAKRLNCFAFLAGHESFAAAEGAIKIAEMANKVRKEPLRVILNGLGKDAAKIISRINGFTYVQTQFDYMTGEVNGYRGESFTLTVFVRKLSATALTTFARVWLSCVRKVLTYLSRVTLRTRLVSNTR